MTHPEGSDASKRKVIARLERNRVALPNLFHCDQRHFGENLCELGFTTNFLISFGLFWHALDIVWIGLFSIVYLGAHL